VNILQGTDSHYGFSKGNTLPLVATPFGMNHWSLQTERDGGWFFSPRARKLQGVRCTHQPSPWMGDYGSFAILPQCGKRFLAAGKRATSYRLDKSTLRPYHFATELIQSGIQLEMAPTERGAIFRFEYPEGKDARVIIEPTKGESEAVVRDAHTVTGFTRGNSGGVPDGFAHYFVAIFDQPITASTRFVGDEPVEGEASGKAVGISVEFGAVAWVTMRIATSFISVEQAERNLQLELAEKSFEEIRDEAKAAWNETLGRIQIEATDSQKTVFYSCLYRTQLFPRIWHEVGEDGALRHRSPYDGLVHPGVLYTDNGFWDTYRTEYPLLALVWPDRLKDILQGWVNAYKEGGWFPQWATPGYRACMVGTHIDAVIADAVVRGVTDFDVETAYEGMVKHATQVGDPSGAWGRIGIEDYLKLGYVPVNRHHESVARSLDYAYDDFCISQVAAYLGRTEDAEKYRGQAQTYRNLYDPEVGFMRGKNADGTWQTPFDEFWWGNPYVEGGPWQASWAVQHDPAGLIELMGGDEAFVAKLDQMMTMPPRFENGAYGMEIHEMTEMACADFGQYAHSNQPVHHVLYLYAAAGQPWKTQQMVARAREQFYTENDLAGDEDNGEMCAWFVLSALGIFPLCPGHPSWVLGTPLYKRAVVSLGEGKALTIEAPNVSSEALFATSATLNGSLLDGADVAHGSLANGGNLTFEMAASPNESSLAAPRRPFSLSQYK